jgi:hypothetical protein
VGHRTVQAPPGAPGREALPNSGLAAARSRLREGVSPESAAVLFHAVLNGLQLQWVLDQDLDIVGPVRLRAPADRRGP